MIPTPTFFVETLIFAGLCRHPIARTSTPSACPDNGSFTSELRGRTASGQSDLRNTSDGDGDCSSISGLNRGHRLGR